MILNPTIYIFASLVIIMFKASKAFVSSGMAICAGKSAFPRFRTSSSKNLARPTERSLPALSNFPTLPAALDIFNLFDQDLMPSFTRSLSSGFDMDIKETDKAYEIMADVPGVNKKDINISVRDNQLIITAERSEVKKEERDNYRRIERTAGHMSRSFYLPHHVHADQIEAKSENGVLHVTIPKSEEHPEDAKKIEVQ